MSLSNYHNLLYTAIAKDGQLLISYTDQQGNFQKVASQIIDQVKTKSRQSYKHHLIKFHTFHDGEYLFLCIVDEEYKKRIAYMFLDQLQNLFYELPEEYRNDTQNLQKFFYKHLKQQFEFFNTSKCDKTLQAEESIQSLKQTLISNLDKCIERGENINLLVEKSKVQVDLSTNLRKDSKKLRNIIWWKSKKLWIMLSLLTIFLIYFILVYSCGGFGLESCIGGNQKDPIIVEKVDKKVSKKQNQDKKDKKDKNLQESNFNTEVQDIINNQGDQEDLYPSFLAKQM